MTSRPFSLALSLTILVGCSGPDPRAEAHAHGEHDHASHAGPSAAEDHAAHVDHGGHEPIPAESPTLNTSIFQLESRFTDASGSAFPLSRLSGEPSLIVMFYGSCTTICPILAEDARAFVHALTPAEREHLRVVFVTFDPQRDTAERMVEHARSRGFDLDHTVLLRGASDGDIRELSAVLGVQYRRLADGNFAHSAALTLLDREGRIVERVEGLHQPNEALLSRARAILAAD